MKSYHQDTAYTRGGLGGHFMDNANQPWPYKRFRDLEARALTQPQSNEAPFWPLALAWPPRPWSEASALDEPGLSALIWLAAGLSAQLGSGIYLRTPASAGALYPAELYLASQDLEFLEDGLWHFASDKLGLGPLRPGAWAGQAAQAMGGEARSLAFIISGMFWRSLWKYRTRAWRYCLLDAGHLLANLELACASAGLPQALHLEFVDQALGDLLGLEPEREVALAGLLAGPEVEPAATIDDTDWQAPAEEPLSRTEGSDPQILAAHRAGVLDQPRPQPEWSQPTAPLEAIKLNPEPPPDNPGLFQVVAARRSRRNFLQEAISAKEAALLLAGAMPTGAACRARVLVHGGDDLPSGLYEYYPGERALELIEAGDRRRQLAEACLGQLWVGQAGLSLVLWADLEHMEAQASPRAYRQAMLAAGRIGQRLYLAATALGLGCCGVGAFFDQEVAQAAALPRNASPLYVVSCGPVKGGLGG